MASDYVIPSERLIETWHSDRSRIEIAHELGVTQSVLEHKWAALQIAGALPRERRTTAYQRPASATRMDDNTFDGRPRISSEDKLLQRLRAVHGMTGDET